MMLPHLFVPAAVLLVDKNGEPLRPWDAPNQITGGDFFMPGCFLTVVAIVYALVITVVRRKRERRVFSYTYWLVLGSGIAMMLVPFASLAIRSAIDYLHH